MSSAYYTFHIYGGGFGETVEEAWADCQENFNILIEEQPMTYLVEEEGEEHAT